MQLVRCIEQRRRCEHIFTGKESVGATGTDSIFAGATAETVPDQPPPVPGRKENIVNKQDNAVFEGI